MSTSHFYENESQSERLARKSKETPFFPIAIGVCAATCVYGAYMFKRRGKMSPSIFLMKMRVAAQGLAVGTLTLGLGYTMFNEHLRHTKSEKD
ncbi:hypothetical protein PPYR_08080 [Photinus pyralis]|uniref:HIG1 domain-containing protein n=1 Tax=Photinus pyralis TaxID=7054 RepID=A0A5N4AIH8_PHOPY|nr:HIG1 domain family member 1A, mitochondrial-like [Photinus pyralis]XP_031347807.1 HIG1 domain family member 1A, mitochondrial-like [Photinus pyralis]KAB0796379.1 hypothetical protein PPYR_10440 [Photinus pyralis]KAB0797086.1 hypothetical protein PPYR_08080 [Photinus pyralis]